MSMARGSWLMRSLVDDGVGGALPVERVEAFFGQAEKVGSIDLKMMRMAHRIVDALGDEFAAGVLAQGRVGGADETALAGNRLDNALPLELGVGLGDGVAVDAELLGERTDRGERV